MKLFKKKKVRGWKFFSRLRQDRRLTELFSGPPSTKKTKQSSSCTVTCPVNGSYPLSTQPCDQTYQYDLNFNETTLTSEKLLSLLPSTNTIQESLLTGDSETRQDVCEICHSDKKSTHQIAPCNEYMTQGTPQTKSQQILIDVLKVPHIDHITPNISQTQNRLRSTDTHETGLGVCHLTPERPTSHTETYQTSSAADQIATDNNHLTAWTRQIKTLQTFTYTTQTVQDTNHKSANTAQTRTLLTFTYTIQTVPNTYHLTPGVRQTSIPNIRPVSDEYFMTQCTRQTKTLHTFTYITQAVPDNNYETPDTHKTETHQTFSDINHMTPNTPQSKPLQPFTDIIQGAPNINHMTSDTPWIKPLQVSADTIQTAPDINYMTPDIPQGKPLQTYTNTTHTAPDINYMTPGRLQGRHLQAFTDTTSSAPDNIHMTPGTLKGKPRQLFFSTTHTVPDIINMTPDLSQSNPLQTSTDIIQTVPDVNHMTPETSQRKPLQTSTEIIQTVLNNSHKTPDTSQVKTQKTSTKTNKTLDPGSCKRHSSLLDPPNVRQTRGIEYENNNSSVGPHDSYKIFVDILLQIPFIRERMERAEMTSASNGCKWTPAMRDAFILDAEGNVDASATKIFGENPFLGELSNDPILSSILKHILHERKDYFQFDSLTNCFRNFIQNFISGSKIDSVSPADTEKYVKMGEWAFETLKRGKRGKVWSKWELYHEIRRDCLEYFQEMGILVERSPCGTAGNSDTSDHVTKGIGFVHEIFCDWFAAYYVIDIVLNKPAKLDKSLGEIDPFCHPYIYRFVCGLCNISQHKVLKYLKDGRTTTSGVVLPRNRCVPPCPEKLEKWKIFRLLCMMEQPEREWPEGSRKSIQNLCIELNYDDTCMRTIAITFREVASWKKISIRELRIQCFQSVNRDISLEGIVLKQGDATLGMSTLCLQSPPVLPPRLLIEKLCIELKDDLTTSRVQGILDYCTKSEINILELCTDSLGYDDCKEVVPDFNLDSSILNDIRSKGMTIEWFPGSWNWFKLNLQTGKFERTSQ